MCAEPEFPIHLTWHESGEVESYDSRYELLCNLEDFDSDLHRQEAQVRDARGRDVWIRVRIWEDVCEVRLAVGQTDEGAAT